MLDSGASISVLNYPTCLTIAKLLNITCNNQTYHTSKTLTVANQTEVPILHYKTTTLNTSIEQTSSQFITSFVVADIQYNVLGTPFVEEYIQNINFKTIQNNLNINPKINRIPLNLLLSFQKTIHISLTYTELIVKHKYV